MSELVPGRVQAKRSLPRVGVELPIFLVLPNSFNIISNRAMSL